MTEQEWLASNDPRRMLSFICDGTEAWRYKHRVTDRKLRLFACACRRQVPALHWSGLSQGWQDMEDCPKKKVLAGGAGPESVPALELAGLFIGNRLSANFKPLPFVAANILRDIIGNPFQSATLPSRNRWGPLWWIAESVAKATYDERLADSTLDPIRLAVLADALEEAGYADEPCLRCDYGKPGRYTPDDGWGISETCKACSGSGKSAYSLLAHLRSPGPHYRGCWTIDLLLGKE